MLSPLLESQLSHPLLGFILEGSSLLFKLPQKYLPTESHHGNRSELSSHDGGDICLQMVNELVAESHLFFHLTPAKEDQHPNAKIRSPCFWRFWELSFKRATLSIFAISFERWDPHVSHLIDQKMGLFFHTLQGTDTLSPGKRKIIDSNIPLVGICIRSLAFGLFLRTQNCSDLGYHPPLTKTTLRP